MQVISNIDKIDKIVSFDNSFYVISILKNDTVETVYYPTDYISLYRYIPEIKDICRNGKCTAYITVNSIKFDSAKQSLLDHDALCGYDILRNAYLAALVGNNIVIHIHDKSDDVYNQVIDIIHKYTSDFRRIVSFDGQDIVVKMSDDNTQLLLDLSNIAGISLPDQFVLYGVKE